MERQIASLYIGEDFTSYAEYAGGFLFLHCDVIEWNLKTLRKIKTGIVEVKRQAELKGYNQPLLTYTRNPRWVKLIGGKYKNTFEVEGKEYELWAWE